MKRQEAKKSAPARRTSRRKIDPVVEVRRLGRWMLLGESAAPLAYRGRYILIEAVHAFDARVIGRRYLAIHGATAEQMDGAQVAPWHPNGWLPPKVVIVSKDPKTREIACEELVVTEEVEIVADHE